MARYRTLLICIGYMAVLVLGGVVADRVIANRTIANYSDFVPAYRSFQEFLAGKKLRQVDDEGGFPQVFLGNSRTLFGVNPIPFDTEFRTSDVDVSSYNLAMPTVDPRFWSFFFEEYYEETPPKHVFYGITPRDIDARNRTAEPYQAAFAASPGFSNRNRTGIWKWSEEVLAQLNSLRGRVEETRRARKKDIFRPAGQRDNLARQYSVDNDRGWSSFPPRFTKSQAFLRRDKRRYEGREGIQNLKPGPERVQALEDLDRWVREHGGCVTFFSLPVLYDPEPWGTQRMRRQFREFMREFTRTHPETNFVDVGRLAEKTLPVRYWGDADHLNAEGATKFSRELARALEPSLQRGCSKP